MYTCKEIRDIVKAKLKYEPRLETIQDQDYFDLIKRGLKRLHRILTTVNYKHYEKIQSSYDAKYDSLNIVDFPSDLYKVVNFRPDPSLSTTNPTTAHWMEAASVTGKGLLILDKAKSGVGTSYVRGALYYIREVDMPTDWASTPDLPDGYDDWLIQYVIAEAKMTVGDAQFDLGKLKELDEMVIAANRTGGSAGQAAKS